MIKTTGTRGTVIVRRPQRLPPSAGCRAGAGWRPSLLSEETRRPARLPASCGLPGLSRHQFPFLPLPFPRWALQWDWACGWGGEASWEGRVAPCLGPGWSHPASKAQGKLATRARFGRKLKTQAPPAPRGRGASQDSCGGQPDPAAQPGKTQSRGDLRIEKGPGPHSKSFDKLLAPNNFV